MIPQPSTGYDYDRIYTTADTIIIPDFIHGQVRRIISSFARYRQCNRLMDLGCGSAVFMQEAAAEGWEVSGVDISRSAVENVRRLGFRNVFHGQLAAAGQPAGHFDVIVASEVFEHVADLQPLLREIVRILRPGGLLWASTPHARGLSFRLLGPDWSVVSPPAHLQLFSVAGMKILLKAAGFQRMHLATHGFNPYEVLYARRLRLRGGNGTMATHKATADPQSVPPSFDPVATARTLNEGLMRTPVRRACKQILNALLSASRLGDRLKLYAIR